MDEESRGFARRILPAILGVGGLMAVVCALVAEAAAPSFGSTSSLDLPEVGEEELVRVRGEFARGRRRVSFRPRPGEPGDAPMPGEDGARPLVSRYPGRRDRFDMAAAASPSPAAPGGGLVPVPSSGRLTLNASPPPAPAPVSAPSAPAVAPAPAAQLAAVPAAPLPAPAASAPQGASLIPSPPAPDQGRGGTSLLAGPPPAAPPVAPPPQVSPAGPPLGEGTASWEPNSGWSIQHPTGGAVPLLTVPVGVGPGAPSHLARVSFPPSPDDASRGSMSLRDRRRAAASAARQRGMLNPTLGQAPVGGEYPLEPGASGSPPPYVPPEGQPPPFGQPGFGQPGQPGGFPQPGGPGPVAGPNTNAGGGPPGSPVLSGQTLDVNYKDADIRSIVFQIADRLKLNFYVDPSLAGKVTLIGPKTMPIEFGEVLLRAILEFQGFAIESVGGQVRRIIKLKSDATNRFGPFVPLVKDIPPDTGRTDLDLEKLVIYVFRFKHVGVNEMLNLIRFFIGTGNNVLPYIPGNLLFVVDHALNLRRIQQLVDQIDVPGPQRKITTVKVNHAQAKPLAEKVQQILAKRSEGEADPGTREFKLGKPTLIPDDRTNNILLISLEDDVRMIVSLIEQLDTKEIATPYVKIIHLQFAEAESVANQANQAFKVGGSSDPSLTYNVIADPKTQSIILSSYSQEMLDKVENLIQTLDNKTTPEQGIDVHHYRMKFALAKDIEKLLSALDSGTQAKGGTPTKILADEASNSLVIVASRAKFEDIKNVLTKLDVLRPQVLIETLIVELSQSLANQFSSDFNIIDADTANARGFGLGSTGTINNFFSGQNSGITLGVLAPGTFDINAAATGNAAERSKIQYLFRMFKSDNRANIIQSPRLMTADNSTAKLTVGAKVQVIQGFAQTSVPGQIPVVNFTSEDLGLSMELTPRITKNDYVSLKFKAELKDRVGGAAGSINFGPIQTPVFTKTSVENEVLLKDDQTLIIGGLIRENKVKQVSKIPGIGDLPIIGRLFSSRNKTTDKNDTLVFLTPHIVRTAFDNERVTDAETRPLQWRDLPGHTWPHDRGLPVKPKQIAQDLKRSGLPYRKQHHKPPKLFEHNHRHVANTGQVYDE